MFSTVFEALRSMPLLVFLISSYNVFLDDPYHSERVSNLQNIGMDWAEVARTSMNEIAVFLLNFLLGNASVVGMGSSSVLWPVLQHDETISL